MTRDIYFLSDFGVEDAYVGIVKAVIAGIAPEARVIDLAHALPPQDLRRAGYQLYQAAPYLPEGSIVLAVVDPGVGSAREAIALRTERLTYVAPDNDLLSAALLRDPPLEARALRDPRYRLPSPSSTFHGRDLFGPAAAYLAAGLSIEALGPALPLEGLASDGPLPHAGGEGQIWTFDRFGNAITDLCAAGGDRGLELGGRALPLRRCYAEVARGEPLTLVGSAGMLEISVREGSAREALGLREGDPIRRIGGA